MLDEGTAWRVGWSVAYHCVGAPLSIIPHTCIAKLPDARIGAGAGGVHGR